MNAYATITILVTVGAALIGLVDFLRSGGPLRQLSHRGGGFWFEHPGDLPIEQRPSEDAIDAPIPRRPLRGRLDVS